MNDVSKLSKKLTVEEEFTLYVKSNTGAPMDEIMFHVLYNWHCKDRTATKKKLALLLHECGLLKQALSLCPKCKLQQYLIFFQTNTLLN